MDLDVISLDGTVIASGQKKYPEYCVDQKMFPMMGIILSVQPADDKDNFSSLQKADRRGYRHECTVLCTDTLGQQPDLILKNVVIPPERHSGIDNFEEDLPRGCSALVSGKRYDDEFKDTDYGELDGEWCVVSFVGGKIQDPYISNWWPHPSNVFAPASSGFGHPRGRIEEPGEALEQVDLTNNLSRAMRRINGTYFLINKQGSFYLDTTESNSLVKVKDGKLERKEVKKGGHIQVDINTAAQMEFNWNAKETADSGKPRLGAGSDDTNQVHDEDLPHEKQPVKGNPDKRETKRSIIRTKEFTHYHKTSKFVVFCEDQSSETGGEPGEFLLMAQDQVVIAQQPDGGTACKITMADGNIILQSDDGDMVTLGGDQVALMSKTGANISIQGANITISPPCAIGLGTDSAVKGTTFFATHIPTLSAWSALLAQLTVLLPALKAWINMPTIPEVAPPSKPITTALDKAIDAVTAATGSLSGAVSAHSAAAAAQLSTSFKLV